MTKKIVAVAMGGYSSEFDISINSGTVVYNAICKETYQVFAVHITTSGWFCVLDSGEKTPVNKENFSFFNGKETVTPDVVFNIIHGTPGEDGLLQAYFEILNVPQTSCDFYQAALTFNKRDCLSVLKAYGVPCAKAYYLNKGQEINKTEIIKTVGLPCFVKPSRSGSSYGVSKVNAMQDLENAITNAFTEDNEILIESCLVGPEVSVGVVKFGDTIVVLPPTEIISENEFFDFEAKYLGKSREITPARISDHVLKKLESQASSIYNLLNLKGICRADFIIQDNVPHFIEVNTNPGLSEESIIPKQIKEYGSSLQDFFGRLIQEALKK